jgi:hypothetical protein
MSRWAALAALVLIAAACGGTGTSTSPSPSPAATKASSKPPPALSFKLNGINTTAKGTIALTAQNGSLTIELKITGLQTASVHASHIHVGNCTNKGGIIFALNQVVADGQGDADIRSTLKATYPPAHGTWYVVVHAGPDLQGSNATYLLCGNLFK